MNGHVDDARLGDHIEGLLTEDVARQVDAHLEVCEECSGRLEALTGLVTDLARLPDTAEPARDLWPYVRAGIEVGSGHDHGQAQGQADGPVPISVSRPATIRGTPSITVRRFSFSATQLLAASIVLILLSGGSVWMALGGGPGQATDASIDPSPIAGARDGSGILPIMPGLAAGYQEAIESLESVLAQGRGQLDPETIATVEASLAIIDRAIEEALAALVDEPDNEALNRLLIKHQQSKLRVLRQLSAAVQI